MPKTELNAKSEIIQKIKKINKKRKSSKLNNYIIKQHGKDSFSDESSFSFNRFGVKLCMFSVYHGSFKDSLKEHSTSWGGG